MAGVELRYDEHLRGTDGFRYSIVDGRRRAIDRAEGETALPVDGGHLVLTLDAELQRLAEEKVALTMDKFEAQSGLLAAMDPVTGEVLAMANWPSFDPGSAGQVPAAMRRNRVLTDPVEPGSTFKAFVVSAALEGRYIDPAEEIDCHMGRHYFGRRLVKDTKPHGLLNLVGIVTKSSNIGMGIIGERMGNGVLHETAKRFGFGSPTGIDCPGEGHGVVYPLSRWTSYSTTSIAMGYEVLVTPVQLMRGYAALVNGGLLVVPRVVSQRLGPDGNSLARGSLPEPRRVMPREISQYVSRVLLRAVVRDGGGKGAQVGPYPVAGKTGTAKLVRADGRGYEEGAYLSLFVGAAPADRPRLVVVAMIRRPNASLGYYGSTVAAPLAGGFLQEALTYLQVPVGGDEVAIR